MAVGTLAAIGIGLSATSTGLQVAGGIKQAKSQEEQAAFQAQQDRFNAQIAELQADDAIARGEVEAEKLSRQASGLVGSQKTAAVGQGVTFDSGSAADIIAETEKASRLDVLNIKNNAAREAFGYKVQAMGYKSSGEMALKAGKNAASSSLLTAGAAGLQGVGNAFGSFQKYKDESSRSGKNTKES